MSAEDGFLTAIDENRNDTVALLAYADWLRDRDDPRADGYQAIAGYRLAPHPTGPFDLQRAFATGYLWSFVATGRPRTYHLTELWFNALDLAGDKHTGWVWAPSHLAGLDAAARAYARLPDAVRARGLRDAGSGTVC